MISHDPILAGGSLVSLRIAGQIERDCTSPGVQLQLGSIGAKKQDSIESQRVRSRGAARVRVDARRDMTGIVIVPRSVYRQRRLGSTFPLTP